MQLTIYYMGGALGECYETETISGNKVNAIAGANVTPYAEYNVLYDPSALEICITAGFPQQFLIPAELSVDFDSKAAGELRAHDCKMARMWDQYYEDYTPEYPYRDPVTAFAYLKPACVVLSEEKYVTVNTDREDDRFGETTALDADGYNALSEQDRSGHGKVTVINEVKCFWDEALRLLCLED